VLQVHSMRRRRSARRSGLWQGLLGVATVALILMALARKHLGLSSNTSSEVFVDGIKETSALDLIHERSLKMVEPATDYNVYRVIVLAAKDASAEWQLPALRPALDAAISPLHMTWHSGDAALKQYPSVTSLPAAVLVQPYCAAPMCKAATIWRPHHDKHKQGSPAQRLARFVRGAAEKPFMLIANDDTEDVTFRFRPPKKEQPADGSVTFWRTLQQLPMREAVDSNSPASLDRWRRRRLLLEEQTRSAEAQLSSRQLLGAAGSLTGNGTHKGMQAEQSSSSRDGSRDVLPKDETMEPQEPEMDGTEHVLPPKGREWLPSAFGTKWTATGSEGNKDIRGRHVVSGTALMTALNPTDCNFFTDPGCKLERPNKAFKQETLEAREDAEASRLVDIRNQSATIRRYTPEGFKKTRAPPAIFATLHSYFQAHAANYSREEWEAEDIFVNHDQAQFLLVDMPDDGPMRPWIFDTLRPIFEAWSGTTLKPAAIYGVRVYTEGAVLRDHVDVPETHHVSAILNIDQDLERPWPLEIYDHEGRAHQADLQPGDMLLYEGASCAHGRPRPLVGNWMANVFVHFTPTDGVLLN